MQLVEIKNLSVGYNGHCVLRNFDLTVGPGEFVSIIGPNGAGKTTLLRTLMGFLPAQKGSIEICNKLNPKPKDLASDIGYVPQKIFVDKTIPISVKEFLNLKSKRSLTDFEIHSIKAQLAIEPLESKCLGTLSTGEQQRVFLTFALIGKPRLILLDESLEGIDWGIQTQAYQLLNQRTQEGCSVILISHDISAVSRWSRRVVCLSHRKIFDGSPQSAEFHRCIHEIYGEMSIVHEHTH